MPDNKSVILVQDFESPKELAEFIKYLNKHDEEYNKYLEFKTSGIKNDFLVHTIQTRDWGTHDADMHFYNEDEKENYFEGFECYICRQITADPKIKNTKRKHASLMECPKPVPSVGDKNRKLERG